ncbi:MAG: CotH kinase family protein [Lachnospiraceae bacterium]|nr:CotH kinase family protein [Lachnospiraceae bacterium]
MAVREVRTYIVTGLIVLLLVCGAMNVITGHMSADVENNSQDFTISADSGFYESGVIVELKVPDGMRVFYSLNDYIPDEESGILYTEPIMIQPRDDERVYNINFVSVKDTGETSECVYRTYFVGKNIKSRYDTLVLSVYGDPDGLFGYDDGIFVSGKDHDDFFEEKDPESQIYSLHFANYMRRGRESERQVHAEFFTPDGNEIMDISCGIRITGASSRVKQQKSFKLYARREYDEQNKFRYPVFDKLRRKDGSIIASFKKMVVRNAGSDNGYGYIRNELLCSLADEYDLIDTINALPVTVYLNGEYYGIYWLENDIDNDYLKNKYLCENDEGDFAVFKGGDMDMSGDENEAYLEEYNDKIYRFADYDYEDAANREKLNAFIDTKNYLMLFAIEYYTGNTDFPTNNVCAYRFISADNNYTPDTVFDGRYHYALYDLDKALGYAYDDDMRLLEGIAHEFRSKLFMRMLQSDYYRDIFVNDVCDIMNFQLSPENIRSKLAEMHDMRKNELKYMLDETALNEVYDLYDRDKVSYDLVEEEIDWISEVSEERPERLLENMRDYFGLEDTYILNVSVAGGFSGFEINSVKSEGEDFIGVYFSDIPVKILPLLSENEEFAYWKINGKVINDKELVIDGAYISDGHIKVELYTNSKKDAHIEIKSIKAKGQNDYIELTNRSGSIISTDNYYLSDGMDKYAYRLPGLILKSGESLIIYCKNYSKPDGLGKLKCNFNIKEGENITLSKNDALVESVLVPNLAFSDGIYEKDFYLKEYNERRIDE